MRQAMAEAAVGDDVYGEDPTVEALQQRVAALLGHEAALFAPSGTMTNQIALQLLVAPGEELLCDADAHVVTYELGAAAAFGGISSRTWPACGGAIDVEAVAAMIRPAGYHAVATRAIAVEQTHNRAGGQVISLERLRALRAVADEAGIGMHCDGARIWNAHVADGVPLAEYGRLFETVSVCLSKGLGAPVGSLVVSSAERIDRAVTIRKRLGGGMRQVGMLAAAGDYALRHNVARLAEDHGRARRLAEALAPFGLVEAQRVRTNIVPLDLRGATLDAPTLATLTRERGVLVSVLGPRTARLVTHLDVDDAGIEHAISVLVGLLRS
ncbi:MAG: aminotransferase class I/II-fold pyridoxal phosphate-dependent enzyme [Micromonosporaceae bacterium]|nr:aminotransferase class I/II-fold pyridoxal phosphate-dependent enzyme [Micromonosporaceae bacterium]